MNITKMPKIVLVMSLWRQFDAERHICKTEIYIFEFVITSGTNLVIIAASYLPYFGLHSKKCLDFGYF